MRGGHLGADTRLVLGYDGVEKSGDVYALFEHALCDLLAEDGVVKHYGNDRVILAREVKAVLFHLGAEVFCVIHNLVDKRVVSGEHFDNLEGGSTDRRCDGVGEEVGTASLTEEVDDLASAAGKAAACTAECLAEGAGDDVYSALHAAVLCRAAAGSTDEAGCVAIVDDDERAVLLCEVAYADKVSDDAVHRENAVCHYDLVFCTCGVSLLELCLKILHIVVLVAVFGCLGESYAVNDAGVIELVGDDRIFLGGYGFKQAAVCIKAAAVKNGILGAEELGKRCLKLLMYRLSAADKAHAGHTVAVLFVALGCDPFELLVVCKAKVVVGTEVQNRVCLGGVDRCRLRRGDYALLLPEACALDLIEYILIVFSVYHINLHSVACGDRIYYR